MQNIVPAAALPLTGNPRRGADGTTYINPDRAGTIGTKTHVASREGYETFVSPPLSARMGRDANSDRGDGSKAWVMEARIARNGGPPATGDDSTPLVGGLRRLTPLECERLQGWPDDHTKWTADGRLIADTHRYHMTGNGVTASVAEYIGHRLVRVDELWRADPS